MNKIALTIILLLTGATVFAQTLKLSEVPEPVRAAFLDINPEAINVEWEKKVNFYEAEFKNIDTETSLVFDKTGKLLFRVEEIPVNTLPEKIIEYSTLNLNSERIDDVDMITNEFGVITFEVEINGEEYLFDVEGNFISKGSAENIYEDYDDQK